MQSSSTELLQKMIQSLQDYMDAKDQFHKGSNWNPGTAIWQKHNLNNTNMIILGT